jgi:hypothetical protein
MNLGSRYHPARCWPPSSEWLIQVTVGGHVVLAAAAFSCRVRGTARGEWLIQVGCTGRRQSQRCTGRQHSPWSSCRRQSPRCSGRRQWQRCSGRRQSPPSVAGRCQWPIQVGGTGRRQSRAAVSHSTGRRQSRRVRAAVSRGPPSLAVAGCRQSRYGPPSVTGRRQSRYGPPSVAGHRQSWAAVSGRFKLAVLRCCRRQEW